MISKSELHVTSRPSSGANSTMASARLVRTLGSKSREISANAGIIDSVNNLKKKNVPDIITQSTELFEKQRLDNISSTDTIPSTNADLSHPGLFIYPEEIKTKTSLQKRNTSFKNRKFSQRSTSKYREPT